MFSVVHAACLPNSSGQIALAGCQDDAGHVGRHNGRAELAHLGDQVREHLAHEACHTLPERWARQNGAWATEPPPQVSQQSVSIAATKAGC